MKAVLYFVLFNFDQKIEVDLLEGERIVSVSNLGQSRQVWIEGTHATSKERFVDSGDYVLVSRFGS